MTIRTSAVALAGGVLLVLGVGSCGALDTLTGGTSSSQAPGTPSAEVSGQAGGDEGGDVDVAAEVGDCLSLTGSEQNAKARKKDCGDSAANYRVVSRAKDENSCPADADSVYFEQTRRNTTTGALCLDRNWRSNTCYSEDRAAKEYAEVPCTQPNSYKYITTVAGKTGAASCPDPADTGLSYSTRNFVVCLQETKGTA